MYNGAYHFLLTQKVNNINNRNHFLGALNASRILFDEISDEGFNEKIVNENTYVEYINRTESQLNSLIERLNNESNIKKEEFDKSSKKAIEQIDNLINFNAKQLYDLSEKYKQDITASQKAYSELLKFSKPIEHWNEKIIDLNKEVVFFSRWLMGVGLFTVISIYCLLWFTPEGLLTSLFDGGSVKAIRWSILFILYVSFLIFGFRAILKNYFSAKHLIRDAEERKHLTGFYLSLLQDNKFDDKDSPMVIQSLFSRSDSGLLKDEAAPAFPINNIRDLRVNN